MKKNRQRTSANLKVFEQLTSPPLNKVDREQLWPQSNHLLLADSSTMLELPANAAGD